MPDYMAMNSTFGGAVMAASPQFDSVQNAIPLSGLVPIALTIIIIMLGMGILIYGLSALERYKRLWAAIEWYAKTLIYTAYGVVLCGVVGGIYLICNTVASAASSIDPLIVVYVVGGYVGVTVLGYVGVLAYRKLREQHVAMKKEQPHMIDSL
jgi:hypothetical protein